MTLMTPPPLDVITEFCFPLSAAINLFTLLPIQLPSKADLLVFTVVLVRFRLVDPSFYTDFFFCNYFAASAAARRQRNVGPTL